jgi:hypothetical protein
MVHVVAASGGGDRHEVVRQRSGRDSGCRRAGRWTGRLRRCQVRSGRRGRAPGGHPERCRHGDPTCPP